MSVSAIPSSDKMVKKSSYHRRNRSGELDVFEAARYFSAIAEKQSIRGGRISLDVPVSSLLTQETDPPALIKQQVKEKKHSSKHPKPSSPGARLATFLNSIFTHTGSGKKKPKSVKDEEESPGGRRRRPRSSISHFRSSSTSDAKSYQDFRACSDHNHNGMKVKQPASQDGDRDLSWLDEKLKLIESYTEKHKTVGTHEYLGKKETIIGRSIVVDEGAESDSSSDLFELENCDLGLPVYETTNMDNIKRGAPIPSAPAL